MKRPDADTRDALQAKAGAERAARATDGASTIPSPTVGTLARKHPAAKRLADLQDPESAALVLAEEHLPLVEALERTWGDDRHMILYRLDADPRGEEYAFARVSKRSPFTAQLEQAGGRVRVPVLAFDHDLPKVNGEKRAWSSADEIDAHLDAIQAAVASGALPEPTAFFDTAHGSRIIYVLDEEVSHLDAEAMARGLIAAFAEAGIELDDACGDWTRLFRLPRTVREDTGKRYEPTYVLTGGSVLAVAECPRVEVGDAAERFAEIDPYIGEMPDPDEVRELLTKEGKNGRTYESDLVKRARLMLQGRTAFDVVFEDKPIVEGEEGWNNAVTRIVGMTVGMLARQDEATPEGIYALLHGAIEQLQYREDRGAKSENWYETCWSLVCRMWASEEAQIIAEHQEREANAAEAKAQRESIIEEHRKHRPDDVPDDPAEAEQWIRRRMIASDGRRHYVRNGLSTFSYKPVGDSMLIPKIRELRMEEQIPVTEPRGKSHGLRSPAHILADHATPIDGIECSACTDVAYIEGDADEKVLYIPIHRLNPKVHPRHDERVAEWLKLLGGQQHEQLVEWISHALDVKRAICALNLYGAPGTGKGMFAAGLAECFRGEKCNDGRVLGKWNLGLVESPVVVCDEAVPNISSNDDESLPLPDAFKQRVTGGAMTIRAMHRDPFQARLYPRIVFTANNPRIVEEIVGERDLTPEDIRAIELRLLSIEVDDAAQRFLSERGNFDFTAGFVAGSVPSRYVIAGHFMYLYENRRPATSGTGRLLVEGNVGGLLPIKAKRAMEDPGHRRGLVALVAMLTKADGKPRYRASAEKDARRLPTVHINGSAVSVSRAFFDSAVRNPLGGDGAARAAVRALEQSGVLTGFKRTRRDGEQAHWSDVSLPLLREFVERHDDLDVSAVDVVDRRIETKEVA